MITAEPGTLFYPEAMFLLLQIIIIFIAFFLHIALIFEHFFFVGESCSYTSFTKTLCSLAMKLLRIRQMGKNYTMCFGFSVGE
jgi:hypothetical protein